MGAWIEATPHLPSLKTPQVAPYMGAWIEAHKFIDKSY